MTNLTAERACALLVDDNPLVLLAMAMLLDSIGWDAAEAQGATQALELLDSKNYPLAIIDLNMPGVSGIELCKNIIHRKEKPTPILLIHSGYIDPKRHNEAISIGVTGILHKPVGRSDMIEAFKKVGLSYTA